VRVIVPIVPELTAPKRVRKNKAWTSFEIFSLLPAYLPS
jgi:hypothetical protein